VNPQIPTTRPGPAQRGACAEGLESVVHISAADGHGGPLVSLHLEFGPDVPLDVRALFVAQLGQVVDAMPRPWTPRAVA
jgi:hypothetical protein